MTRFRLSSATSAVAPRLPEVQHGGPGPLVIFDGDCAFCTRSATWLARRLRPEVRVVAWQVTDLTALGVAADRAQYEVLWAELATVQGGARVAGGAAAIAAALRHCRAPGWRLAGSALDLPPLRWLAPPVYQLIARNRYRLPGGTTACEVPASTAGPGR